MYQSIDPFTNQLFRSFELHSSREVKQKIDALCRSYDKARKLKIVERANVLLEIAKGLKASRKLYAGIITQEMGKPYSESLAEVDKCENLCTWYSENALNLLSEKIIATEARQSKVIYSPIGTILAIMPWNFPFWQVFRVLVPNLLLGNSILLKHAPNVSTCAQAIEDLVKSVMKNQSALEHIRVDNESIEEIIANHKIAGVTLTGSERAGRSVAALAGKYLKKSVLELGGSDPFIVFDDVDIDAVAEQAIFSRLINSGQTCISAKRFIIHHHIYDDFKVVLLSKLRDVQVGNPMEDSTRVGPIARADLAENLEKQLLDAADKQASILPMGTTREDNLIFPKVISNIAKDMRVFQEEVFGPYFLLHEFTELDEGITMANETAYGLGASVWTKNQDIIQKCVNEIQAGCVFANSIVKSDPRLPFGGTKCSGYGRELSSEGVFEFANIKTVWVD